ncbi:ISAs1 family transposase, partial [bacterium]|nr:ISAs1 family transposase [bacterium]
MDYTCLKANEKVTESELVYDLNSLYDYFSRIPDTRSKLGKQYPLTLLLIWILLAKLAGQDKPSAIAEWVAHRQSLWIEYRLTRKAKTASHMTYRRVLAEIVSSEALEDILTRYHRQQLQEGAEIVLSLDGKTVRGTIPTGECQGTHLLAVYVPEQGLVLAEAAVGRKENEIVVAPQVLKQVSLAGKIVMADALHTQKSFCQEVIAADADYVLTAKDNQSHTRWAIEKLFVSEACNLQKGARLSRDFQSLVQIQKGHGRIEKRTILTSTRLNEYLDDWPG